MLLDIDDINELFEKKVDCFGAAVATSATLAGTTAAGVASTSIFSVGALTANMALLSAVGTVMSVGGAIQGGNQAANQAAFQSQVANNNAIIAGQQRDRAIKTAASNEEDYRRQQSDLFGSRRSLMGDTNVVASLGAPLAVSSDFQGETELNALRLRNEGSVNANRLQQTVLNQRSQAGLFGAQGRNAKANSFTRAGGELFSGAYKTASAFS
jgi:hypothetical protein